MLMRLFFSGGKPGSQNFGQILKLYNRNVLKSDKLTENYSEQGEWDRGFSDHYQSHLKLLVDEFETERIAAASLARKKLIWLTPIFALILVIGWQINLWELMVSAIQEWQPSLMWILNLLTLIGHFHIRM